MKTKAIGYAILLTVVALVSAGTSYLVARNHEEPAPANPDIANARKWLHETELDADQLEKLEPHEAALRRDLTSLQILLAQERIAIINLIRDGKSTPESIKNHVNRVSQLEAAQQELVVNHLSTMSQILTPDQKDKFFTSMMSGICTGCREGFCKPGTPCMCGNCGMKTVNKAG